LVYIPCVYTYTHEVLVVVVIVVIVGTCRSSSNSYNTNRSVFAALSTAYAIVRCPSVCPSVRHVHVFCGNEEAYVRKKFFAFVSHTILVFPYQTLWQYSDGDLLTRAGVECRCGRQKSRFSTSVWLLDQ